jgi:hypothetical protein
MSNESSSNSYPSSSGADVGTSGGGTSSTPGSSSGADVGTSGGGQSSGGQGAA